MPAFLGAATTLSVFLCVEETLPIGNTRHERQKCQLMEFLRNQTTS